MNRETISKVRKFIAIFPRVNIRSDFTVWELPTLRRMARKGRHNMEWFSGAGEGSAWA
jgi:hypothetical protein